MTRAILANRHDYKPGDVLSAVWGYEQTNVDYYEVTAITPGTVTVRKIASEKNGNMSGHCAPMPGEFIGEPMTRRPSYHGVKIDDCRRATRVVFKEVDGVRVYRPSFWSSYA